jgi:hypothetical protein
MRLFPVSLLLFSTLHASWDFDIFAKGSELYDETREKTIQIYNDTLKTLNTQPEDQAVRRVKYQEEAWERVSDALREGTIYINERESLPQSSWMGRDKEDVQEDINALFEKIIRGLVGGALKEDQREIEALKARIKEADEKIARMHEARIGAPDESRIHTTKSEYDEKIKGTLVQKKIWEHRIEVIKQHLQKRFADIGVMLTPAQVDVLLTRVDGKDIIRMTMVMDILNYITQQIETLMKKSRESLEQAKRYYGMHQVLLELVIYIQQQYIDKCNQEYIPKVHRLMTQAKALLEKTRRLKAEEEDVARAHLYEKNIEALQWTLKVAKVYEADLIASRDKVQEAQQVAKANLKLSENTYRTVSLSSDLYALISQSQEVFLEVSRIQVPDIVPFQNLQIKRTYQEITQKLK